MWEKKWTWWKYFADTYSMMGPWAALVVVGINSTHRWILHLSKGKEIHSGGVCWCAPSFAGGLRSQLFRRCYERSTSMPVQQYGNSHWVIVLWLCDCKLWCFLLSSPCCELNTGCFCFSWNFSFLGLWVNLWERKTSLSLGSYWNVPTENTKRKMCRR